MLEQNYKFWDKNVKYENWYFDLRVVDFQVYEHFLENNTWGFLNFGRLTRHIILSKFHASLTIFPCPPLLLKYPLLEFDGCVHCRISGCSKWFWTWNEENYNVLGKRYHILMPQIMVKIYIITSLIFHSH